MVSHISRKTSEMWGSQDSFALEVLKTTNNAHPLVYSRVKIPKATAHYSRSYVGRHITGRMEFLVVSFLGHGGILATALLYLRGWSKIRRTRPQIFPPWRAYCFLGGLFALWLAIASPLDTLDGLLLVAHMTQHLILMSVVPPLLLLGAPAVPLLRSLPRSVLRDGLGPFFRAQSLHGVFRLITHPVFAWLAMNIAYIGWHIPPSL